jgi:hypothetical protein
MSHRIARRREPVAISGVLTAPRIAVPITHDTNAEHADAELR